MTALIITLAAFGGLAVIYALGHALAGEWLDGPTVGRRR